MSRRRPTPLWEEPEWSFGWRAAWTPESDQRMENQGEWRNWQSRDVDGPGQHEDLEAQVRATGSCDRGGNRDLPNWGDNGVSKDDRNTKGKEEPIGAEWMEGQGVAWNPLVHGGGWVTTDWGWSGGTRQTEGVPWQTGHGGDEGTKSWGEAKGLTARGGDMVLDARGAPRDSVSFRAGGG